jgi:GNAT superfamily N-acetyltransferase
METSREEIFKLCKNRDLRRLYAAAGQLRYVYKLPNVIRNICIAYVGDLPIGVSVLLKKQTYINTLQVYVDPKYRKLGIGNELVRKLVPYFVGKETYYKSKDNQKFWRKTMSFVSKTEMSVKGVQRTVHLGQYNDDLNGFPARTYVNSKSVAGVVRENIVGAKRFYPTGKNADLV